MRYHAQYSCPLLFKLSFYIIEEDAKEKNSKEEKSPQTYDHKESPS